MKKVLIAAAVTLLAAGTVFAAGTIVGSKHDLATGPMATTYNKATTPTTQICVFCHTPHNGGNAGAPLWNHTSSTASYNLYDSAYSSTIQGTVITNGPGAVSKACLSCHDGTVAVASVTVQPRDVTGVGISGTVLMNPQFNLGTDLRNDHPVGISYEPTLDPGLRANTAATVVNGAITLPLYVNPTTGSNPTVECASCHAVHDQTNIPFLRAANTGSQLCLTCHLK